MMSVQALIPIKIYWAIRIGIYIICHFQTRLSHTGLYQAFQTFISQIRPSLTFQTHLGCACLQIRKKRMKSLWLSFYNGVFVAIWVLKIFCLNKQTFMNILKRLLHEWWWLARGIQVQIFDQRFLIKVVVLKKWSL